MPSVKIHCWQVVFSTLAVIFKHFFVFLFGDTIFYTIYNVLHTDSKNAVTIVVNAANLMTYPVAIEAIERPEIEKSLHIVVASLLVVLFE